MQIHLSPRHLRLTAAIHAFAIAKIAQLEDLGSEILAAHVVLLHDETAKPAERHCAKVHLAVRGPDIHAEETHEDLYAALDLVTAKLERQLRKRKTRVKDKRRSKAQRSRERTRRAN